MQSVLAPSAFREEIPEREDDLAPPADSESSHPRVVASEEAPRSPTPVARVLTREARKRFGIPVPHAAPYRLGFVVFLVALFGIPMAMVGWYRASFALAFVALGVLPAVRWWMNREIALKERVFTHGREVVARILDVEPGGADRHGHIVRLQFLADAKLVAASVLGSPLARRGLRPGDDVVVYYAPEEPTRCLVIEPIVRATTSKPRRVRPPAAGCGAGGCGNPACAGGCRSGACGGGGGCGGCA